MHKYIFCLIILVFIVASDYLLKSEAYRVIYSNDIANVLAFENERIKLECNSDKPMADCAFAQDNDTRYLIAGSRLQDEMCWIEFPAFTVTAGFWTCYLREEGYAAVETRTMRVRIVDEVAAAEQNVTAVVGQPVTLLCVTRNITSLSYCRFEPPNSKPFSINSDVKPTKPLHDRYYFPKDKSLERGECAVTINNVKYEDAGTWMCGAGFEDEREYTDSVTLEVKDLLTRINASLVPTLIAAISSVVLLTTVGFMAWRHRIILIGRRYERNERNVMGLQYREPGFPWATVTCTITLKFVVESLSSTSCSEES